MSEGQERSSAWVVVLAAAAVVATCVATYAAWWHWVLAPEAAKDFAHVGALGNAFAPVTGFLSILALAAAVVSVVMQRHELELQRRELRETRDVFKEQQKAQEDLCEAQRLANSIAAKLYEQGSIKLRRDEISEALRHRRELLLVEVNATQTLADQWARRGNDTAPYLERLGRLITEVQEDQSIDIARAKVEEDK